MLGRVLVLDDNEAIRTSVAMYLDDAGYEAQPVASLGAAVRALEDGHFDLAVADYMLPDGTALDLLARLRDSGNALPIIVLTGHGSIDLAVRAVRAGAEHFLTKPLELPALLEVVRRTHGGRRAQRHEAATRARARRDALDPFVGTSDPVRRLADEARRVAGSDMPVLLTGETGSGKGVLAAWLHAQSPRASEALVDINCAGLAAPLLESELFGHERGAFTGAHASKPGLFEIADRGTLFLDEMGDLDLMVQPKLLKVLEERRYRRLGSVRDHAVDVRVIAATHLDLAQAVADRRFRGDLYYRINTLVLRVPTLRERPEDIPALAARIFERQGRGAAPPELTPDAVRALQAYGWPGNVRELRNVLERAVLLSDKRVLDADDLRLTPGPEATTASASSGPLQIVSLEENERRYLLRVLDAKGGRVDETAAALGVPLSSLYQRLKRLGITLGRSR
ncbi:MAG: sigma-54-dependent Fis family transcriptional regulator [Deltaproteobacteria bacterium]|nr:sigma-54-dependent Fis family transcriptional regulator [Deltaproteobacteria bacterium]